MQLQDIKDRIPDYAKDLRLNLGSVLTTGGAPGLSETQIWGSALAAAISSRNTSLSAQFEQLAGTVLNPADIKGVRSATAIMGMNNIYYRFLHLVGDDGYRDLPARLRMSVIANPGIDKADFELYSLVASAVTGCEGCVQAHERHLRKAGISIEGIQSAARIASVIHGVAIVLEHENAAAVSAAA
ncbi:MAG: alkyl hydroperoxide reductase [Gammaproteobacteria bacterium]|nr:alkyl hydroperoxide reductase [Gammaproteobacteria bacterium]NNM20585.1 alkyl hydroperoxide reductase [Gammaproteobacteria bacterium]